MKRITIGRYTKPDLDVEAIPPNVVREDGDYDITEHFSGWIEGETDDGKSWIMWIDAQGHPKVFWPERDEHGAVVGDVGINLSTDPLCFSDVRRALKPTDEEGGLITAYPVVRADEEGGQDMDGWRGLLFLVAPNSEGTPTEKLARFLEMWVEGARNQPPFSPDELDNL